MIVIAKFSAYEEFCAAEVRSVTFLRPSMSSTHLILLVAHAWLPCTKARMSLMGYFGKFHESIISSQQLPLSVTRAGVESGWISVQGING